MGLFIGAQLVGLAGYLLYIVSPHFGRRQQILYAEIVAYIALSLQWALLGQNLLFIANMIAAVSVLIALWDIYPKSKTSLFVCLYPLVGCTFFLFGSGEVLDFFAAGGVLFLISSKLSHDLALYRVLSGFAGICFLFSSLLAFCPVAAVFNIIFVFGHIRRYIDEGSRFSFSRMAS